MSYRKKIEYNYVVFADSETTTLRYTLPELQQLFIDNDIYNDTLQKTGYTELNDKMFVCIDDIYYLPFSYVWYVTKIGRNGKEQVHFRTRQEFTAYINRLTMSGNVLLYFHNLPYDFRFLNYKQELTKHYTITNILAYSKAKILSLDAVNVFNNTLSIRDSLKLLNMSVKKLGSIIHFEKLDYNYTSIRYIDTPLDDKELEYGYRDTEIVQRYFCKQYKVIENFDFISSKRFAITATGEIRRDIKNRIAKLYVNDFKQHMRVCKLLNSNMEEDRQKLLSAKAAYYGGLCFSNFFRTGKIYHDVHSIDLTSSYPSCMVYGLYPVSELLDTVELIQDDIKRLFKVSYNLLMKRSIRLLYNQHRGFIAKVKIKNIELKKDRNNNIFPCILSRKEITLEALEKWVDVGTIEEIFDNIGRYGDKVKTINNKIVSGNWIEITVTNVDLWLILQCYNIAPDDIEVVSGYTFQVAKLKFWYDTVDQYAKAKQFHKIMLSDIEHDALDITNDKDLEMYNNVMGADNPDNIELLLNTPDADRYNTLKQLIYTQTDKGRINGLYGINVQNPNHFDYFIDQYGQLDKREKDSFDKSAITNYILGLYITSYARLQLFNGFKAICKCDGLHIYSDTDSLKFQGDKDRIYKHANAFNMAVMGVDKDDKMYKLYGFGGYDLEHSYKSFYTLGSKFYITELYKPDKNGNLINGTISGLTDADKLLNYNRETFSATVKLFCSHPSTTLDTDLMKHTGQLTHYLTTCGTVLLNSKHTLCNKIDMYYTCKIFPDISKEEYKAKSFQTYTLKFNDDKTKIIKVPD